MKIDLKLIICSAGLFLCLFSTLTYADADWGYKSKYSISFELIEKWECSVISETRFRDDMSDHHYSHLVVALSKEFLDWLEIGTSYRYTSRATFDGWKRENRPSINAKLKWSWEDFEFSNNNKLDYRIIQGYEDIFRYKNKLKIEYPLDWTKPKISPYVSEEIFFDFDVGRLNGYRIEAGFSMQLLENSELSIAYQFANDKFRGIWIDRNYLLTHLKFFFERLD